MPSPISSTRPTSWTVILSNYVLISVVSTETISSALNLMTATRQDLVADVVDTCFYGGVVLPVAHPDLDAAQDRRIDLRHHHRLEVHLLFDDVGDLLDLLVVH